MNESMDARNVKTTDHAWEVQQWFRSTDNPAGLSLRATRSCPMMTRSEFHAAGTGAPYLRLPTPNMLDSNDIHEAEHVLGSILADKSIELDESPNDFRLLVRECTVGDLWQAHLMSSSEMTIRSEPLNCYASALTLRGQNLVQHGGNAVAADPHQATTLSPSSATSLSWRRKTEILCLRFPKLALEQKLQKLTAAR